MKLTRSAGGVTIELEPRGAELLALTLRRATFEDTPPERQREILEFASRLLRALDETEGQA